MADGFPLKAGMAFLVGARQRQDSQRHRERGWTRKDMGHPPNPYFLGIALWSTFGIMYIAGKCPGASFTILAFEVRHRTA